MSDAPDRPAARRPPSIAFLIPSLEPGGAERQLVGLATGLHDLGWTVRVIAFADGGAFADELAARGVRVETLGKGGRLDLPAFGLRLIRSLRRARPDVIHPYLLTPSIAATLVRPFVPRARVVWGVRTSNMELARYGRSGVIAFAISRRLARFADLIVCNSRAGLEHHAAAGYPRERMIVIPNGIAAERFRPDPEARRAVRAELGIPPEAPVFGAVGRLDPVKDHPAFLAAAARVAAAEPAARFLCVGGGPAEYRRELADRAAELGIADRVMFTGPRTDLPAVTSALDVAVSSSAWGEGFPNVVAEAMACGVPCVVTDVGDSALVVGETGWVVPPSQPMELADAMIAAIRSEPERQRRGLAARDRIVTEYGEARRDRATAERLERLLPGDR